MTQSLTYVEIDIPFCALTYGVAPCTASIPTTGAVKCFNSIKTCQDRANFSETEITLRFAMSTEYLPREIDCIPSISSVNFSPATVSLGKDLGQRASLTITFQDHRHSDTGQGYDKYLADRDYDPYSQGTFWGKFRARQPFLRGRALRWINGVVGEALADMETWNFVIESFTGPDPDGKFSIVAKDVLKLADGDRSQAPILSKGFLSADITAVATSAVLLPSGIGNSDYAASGYLCIGGNEVVLFSRSGDNLTITRGQLGSTASTHKAQDRVQTVLRYAAEDAAEIIYDLLVGYAGVDASAITLSEWQDETAAFLGNVYTATICEPTSIATLISELVEQAALAVWEDASTQSIRLQVLRAVVTDVDTFTPENTLQGTLKLKEQPDKRLSRVQVYFAQIDPTKPLSNLDNYRSTSLSIDDDAEADYGAAAIKTILSRWIPSGGRAVADRLGAVQLGRYRDPPRNVQFQLQRHASTDVALGVGYRIEHPVIQDETGAESDIPVQVVRLNPGADRYTVEAEEMLWTAPAADTGVRSVIFDSGFNNVNLRTIHDAIYPVPVSGNVVNCTVNAGVVIGSSSTGAPAFDVGAWPAGVTVNIVVKGRIQGAGGRGADGVALFGNGLNGSAGGPALYSRRAVNVDTSSGGQIWSGGGGGGSGGPFATSCGSGGGGGGAGTLAGSPGSGAVGSAATGSAGASGAPTTGGSGGAGGDYFGSTAGSGGSGGGPGLAGSAGSASGAGYVGGTGGAAGSAIDGISYITLTLGAGDIRGAQIN